MTPMAGTPQAASTATYNVNNQLTQWKGASLAYDANGNLTGATTTNSFAYTGRELDPTGLDFFRARYYNPTLQRFISKDPIGFSGGDVDLYAYASNSPTNFIDPSGKSNLIVHLLETYDAGRAAGLGIGDSLNLAVQATLVDVGTQATNASNTNIHAMAGQLPDGSYQTRSKRSMEQLPWWTQTVLHQDILIPSPFILSRTAIPARITTNRIGIPCLDLSEAISAPIPITTMMR